MNPTSSDSLQILATANGRTEGFTKLLFDDSPEAGLGDGHAGHGHGKILGGGIVGPNAGDLIGEVAMAIGLRLRRLEPGRHALYGGQADCDVLTLRASPLTSGARTFPWPGPRSNTLAQSSASGAD